MNFLCSMHSHGLHQKNVSFSFNVTGTGLYTLGTQGIFTVITVTSGMIYIDILGQKTFGFLIIGGGSSGASGNQQATYGGNGGGSGVLLILQLTINY